MQSRQRTFLYAVQLGSRVRDILRDMWRCSKHVALQQVCASPSKHHVTPRCHITAQTAGQRALWCGSTVSLPCGRAHWMCVTASGRRGSARSVCSTSAAARSRGGAPRPCSAPSPPRGLPSTMPSGPARKPWPCAAPAHALVLGPAAPCPSRSAASDAGGAAAAAAVSAARPPAALQAPGTAGAAAKPPTGTPIAAGATPAASPPQVRRAGGFGWLPQTGSPSAPPCSARPAAPASRQALLPRRWHAVGAGRCELASAQCGGVPGELPGPPSPGARHSPGGAPAADDSSDDVLPVL